LVAAGTARLRVSSTHHAPNSVEKKTPNNLETDMLSRVHFIIDCLIALLYNSDMARPRSEDKRNALMAAATRVIVTHGLSAPTAMIAQEAGVSNGSLFTYFETKADMFNQLYLELKTGMASAALEGLPARAELREQVFHIWSNWTRWAVSNPEKRRALVQLGLSHEITSTSRAAGHKTMASIGELLERSRANGPMRDAPMGFVVAIMNSVAEATMDFMVQDQTNADKHCKVGFDALWRVIA
jgi:AcrR family transcriptional regulator